MLQHCCAFVRTLAHMDKHETIQRQGEALTVWIPKGTKAKLKARAEQYGQKGMTGLVGMILAQWLEAQKVH